MASDNFRRLFTAISYNCDSGIGLLVFRRRKLSRNEQRLTLSDAENTGEFYD